MTPELESLAATISPLIADATEPEIRKAIQAVIEVAFAMGEFNGVSKVMAAVEADQAIRRAAA
jgi:hypothetical protein